jgi:hypothetical protein
MNFAVKIFGAPYVFDLYQGTETELRYFQTFDTGKENVKLVVHRREDGQVSYSYLRYKFMTSGRRPGSFFGISVVFNKEYCEDIQNLYKLFDIVYKTIQENKILFEEIKDNPDIQAKYLIRYFADEEKEVKRIENIIRKNIENHFADDIRPLDDLPSILPKNTKLIVMLNDKKGNTVFSKALDKYSWVSISPEYEDKEILLSLEEIAKLDNTIKDLRERVYNISINALKKVDVNKNIEDVRGQIKSCKDGIKQYLKIQPELKERDSNLVAVQKWLDELSGIVSTKNKIEYSDDQEPAEEVVAGDKGKVETVSDEDHGGDRGHNSGGDVTIHQADPEWEGIFRKRCKRWIRDAKGNLDSPKPPAETNNSKKKDVTVGTSGGNPSIRGADDYATLIAIVIVLVLAVVLIVWFFRSLMPDNPKGITEMTIKEAPASTPEENPATLEHEGHLELNKNDFDTVIKKFEQAGKTELVEDAKTKAVAYWFEQAAKEKDLPKKKECLENAKKYGGYPTTDNDIAEVQKQIAKQANARNPAGKPEKNAKSTTDCKIYGVFAGDDPKAEWTVADLLKVAGMRLNGGSYKITLAMCNAIIAKQKANPDCVTKEQLDRAKKLKRQAESQ